MTNTRNSFSAYCFHTRPRGIRQGTAGGHRDGIRRFGASPHQPRGMTLGTTRRAFAPSHSASSTPPAPRDHAGDLSLLLGPVERLTKCSVFTCAPFHPQPRGPRWGRIGRYRFQDCIGPSTPRPAGSRWGRSENDRGVYPRESFHPQPRGITLGTETVAMRCYVPHAAGPAGLRWGQVAWETMVSGDHAFQPPAPRDHAGDQ